MWIKGKMSAPWGYEIWDSGSSSMIDFALYILEKYASTTLAGAAQTIKDALTITPVTVQAGTNVTINRQAVYTFGGFCFVSLSFTTSATITGSSNIMTGFPKPAALTDMPFIRGNATPYHGIINANGNLRFGSSAGGPAAAYQANGVYRIA